ncbi:MAG: helix-turn-helix domain-containing protein [Acidimicrobiales bacterium]
MTMTQPQFEFEALLGETRSTLLLTIVEAARMLSIGRSKAYELIAAGELEVVHIGRAARVPLTSLETFVRRLRRD